MKKALAAAWLTATLGAAGLFWAKPYETARAIARLRLRLRGARVVRLGPLQAYERDLCSPGAPCRCVALIHGLGDSAMTWDKLMLGVDGAPPPPQGARLYAVELPGTDGSPAPATPEGYAIPAMAETVRQALGSGCARWTVVGNSLGGWVAAWLALEWPSGVDRLVLVDAAGLDDPSGVSEATARALKDPTVPGMKEFSKRAYFIPPRVPERAWPGLVDAIKARPTARICDALDRRDLLDDRAARISAPTVVVWGLAGGAVPESVGRAWARLIKGARFVGLDRCGHLPQRECPAALAPLIYAPPG